jgi:perosamine synthetase
MKKIPYGKHYIDEDDISSVVSVLRSENLTQGPSIDKFEKDIAEYVGAKYAVAVSSCTAGLFLSTLVCMKDDSSFYTSPITFVASSNSAFYCGLKPQFVDIDSCSINIDIEKLGQALSQDNSKSKIIMPVHFGGLPCDMERIFNLKDEHSYIIEDAAHALGATYACGSRVGSCKYSDLTVFSFHPVKNIATGEGGIITTNNYETYVKLLRLRSHGITKLNDKFKLNDLSKSEGLVNPWYYEMQELGYHFRMTDIQAALGTSQLKKIDIFLQHRRSLVSRYLDKLSDFSNIKAAQIDALGISANHLFVVLIDFKNLKITRAKLMNELQQLGIYTQVHYIPVPMQPFYKDQGYNSSNFPEANNYYSSALSLPLYYPLSFEDQDFVINALKKLVEC